MYASARYFLEPNGIEVLKGSVIISLISGCVYVFKPPLPVGAGGGYMFLGCPCMRASVRDSCGSFMFLRYLQYLLTDFHQTCHWCISGQR